jgi:hypothetical protein
VHANDGALEAEIGAALADTATGVRQHAALRQRSRAPPGSPLAVWQDELCAHLRSFAAICGHLRSFALISHSRSPS